MPQTENGFLPLLLFLAGSVQAVAALVIGVSQFRAAPHRELGAVLAFIVMGWFIVASWHFRLMRRSEVEVVTAKLLRAVDVIFILSLVSVGLLLRQRMGV